MNIVVELYAPINDGTEVVFRSPADCSQVTGLRVLYPDLEGESRSKEFMFADAHGNNVGDIDHLFAENVAVKVILDVTNGMAFVQNADTNAYLEGRFSELEQMIGAGGGASSGIVNSATGSTITLKDSANSKLQGLKLYGNYTEEHGVVGENGSVTVTVMGKNLLDYRKSIPRRDDQTVEIDESINGVYWTGDYYFYVPLDAIIPKGTTVMFSCKSESVDPENSNYISSFEACYTDGTTEYIVMGYPLTLSKDAHRIAARRNSSSVANTIKVWDMQLEIGTVATAYEPYKDSQTLVVSTPNGLQTGEVLEVADANTLHTHKPNTTIINDAGAEMEVEYVADTKAYIDNKFTELQNAILATGANV